MTNTRSVNKFITKWTNLNRHFTSSIFRCMLCIFVSLTFLILTNSFEHYRIGLVYKPTSCFAILLIYVQYVRAKVWEENLTYGMSTIGNLIEMWPPRVAFRQYICSAQDLLVTIISHLHYNHQSRIFKLKKNVCYCD